MLDPVIALVTAGAQVEKMREKRDGEGAEVVSKGTALAIGVDLGATRQITAGIKRNTDATIGRESGKITKINTAGVTENTQMMMKKNVSAAKSIVIVTGIGTTVPDIVVDVIVGLEIKVKVRIILTLIPVLHH